MRFRTLIQSLLVLCLCITPQAGCNKSSDKDATPEATPAVQIKAADQATSTVADQSKPAEQAAADHPAKPIAQAESPKLTEAQKQIATANCKRLLTFVDRTFLDYLKEVNSSHESFKSDPKYRNSELTDRIDILYKLGTHFESRVKEKIGYDCSFTFGSLSDIVKSLSNKSGTAYQFYKEYYPKTKFYMSYGDSNFLWSTYVFVELRSALYLYLSYAYFDVNIENWLFDPSTVFNEKELETYKTLQSAILGAVEKEIEKENGKSVGQFFAYKDCLKRILLSPLWREEDIAETTEYPHALNIALSLAHPYTTHSTISRSPT